MAVPNTDTPQLSIDVDADGSMQPTTTTYHLRTGGNPSSATSTNIPSQHRSSNGEKNLDYYLPLYRAASRGDWVEAKKFLDNDLNAKEARISNLSMTALHVAASEGHSEFVEKLAVIVPERVLKMHDDMGFTPLHYAAIGGNMRSAKALLKRNPKLAQCVDSKGGTPLLLAATFASSKDLVWYFLSVTTNEEPGYPFTGPWGANLVNVLVASGFHDIALYVLEKYPELAIETDKQDCTPLYVLARNQESFLSGSTLGFWENFMYAFLPIEVNHRPPHSVRADVARHESTQNHPTMATSKQYGVLHALRRILYGAIKAIAPTNFTRLQDAKLRHHCAVELVKRICEQLSKKDVSWRLNYFLTSEILYIAASNGIVEIIRALVEDFPDLIWVRHSNNQYVLLPLAIELRHESLFRMLCEKTARSKLMASTLVEVEPGTILHLAAKLAPAHQRSAISGAALQMQRELQWFKVVEKLIHPYYKNTRNAEKQTARELFTTAHEKLAESGEKWLKDTSNSCMLVATLIATVVFAAAFQLPGGNDSDGSPNALKNNSAVFMVFAVSDTIALFSSLTSLLMFLSILTARYAEEDFLESLPKRLIIGLASLFFAIASTMVAFGATLGIVLGKKYHWVSIPITLLATFPVTLFALLQLPLFIQMVRSTFGKGVFSPQNLR